MGGILSSLLAGISLGLRQPLASFCDVESTHGDHLITKRGEYVSVLRINGLRRMCTRQEVEALAEQQRIELQGLLEERGHAIVGWYISDPERSGIRRFKLSDASAYVIRNALPGPGKNGAPFFVDMSAGEAKYEQLLVNVLGPIELWSFSTTPGDTALRSRLYKRIHFARALRMLATVFPSGTANSEIERRKSERMNVFGLATDEAFAGVLDELADEIVGGRGVAAGLYETLRAIDEQSALEFTTG